MNRDQKAAVVDELAEEIRAAEAIFAVDYRGITVSQAAELRSRLREADTRFRVVKNSLTERASDKAGAESLKKLLEGPTALAFVVGDAAVAAKALNDQARRLGTLEFKGGLMDGAPLSGDEIRSIARLPARDVLHGQLVGMIASPLSGLVRTLNALIAGVAVQLGQIAEQGLVRADSASAPEGTASEPGAEANDGAARVPSGTDAGPPEPEAEAQAKATDQPETEASEGEAEKPKEEA
ncbi:MAG TPA: 50S ribosomal protein L10 [Solirubrobacteraceae bacterium]|jgi:large subunit ribosomal protein L10